MGKGAIGAAVAVAVAAAAADVKNSDDEGGFEIASRN